MYEDRRELTHCIKKDVQASYGLSPDNPRQVSKESRAKDLEKPVKADY